MAGALSQENLLELVERAREAHPDLALDPVAFGQHLTGRAGADGDLPAHVEDLYLAFACGHGDRVALALFETRHLSRVGHWIANCGSSCVSGCWWAAPSRVLHGSSTTPAGARSAPG
jgi:hypothetical protein